MNVNFIAELDGFRKLKTLIPQLQDQFSLLQSLHAAKQELLQGASHSLKYNRVQPLLRFVGGPTQKNKEHERRRLLLEQLEADSMAMCAASFTPKAVLSLNSPSFDVLCRGLPAFVKQESITGILQPLIKFIQQINKRIGPELHIIVMDQTESNRPKKRPRRMKSNNSADQEARGHIHESFKNPGHS